MRCSEASLSVSLKPAVQTISYLEAFGQRDNSLPAKSNLSSPLFATRDVWSEEERLLWQARQFLSLECWPKSHTTLGTRFQCRQREDNLLRIPHTGVISWESSSNFLKQQNGENSYFRTLYLLVATDTCKKVLWEASAFKVNTHKLEPTCWA